jgi:hypothetical protein
VVGWWRGRFDKLSATLRQAQGERYAVAAFFVPHLHPVRAEPVEARSPYAEPPMIDPMRIEWVSGISL